MASLIVPERRMLDGTVWMLLAESLFPLTALITVAYLTRVLGPSGYGLISLTLTTLIWIESGINSFFTKATIIYIDERTDWKPLGSVVVRRSVLAGGCAMLVLWSLAGPLSDLLNEPELVVYFRIAALDIPVLCGAQAYRSILIGLEQYQRAALSRAVRWVCRLALIVFFVTAGISITGVMLGIIGSSLVELGINRWHVGPLMWSMPHEKARSIQWYGTMLFLSSMSLMASNGMDLFMLKILRGTAQQAGLYAAAQSLAFLPSLFSLALSSVLLGTLSRLVADGELKCAAATSRDAMRVTLWLLPVMAIIAGASNEIVQIVFGTAFLSAAPVLSLLSLGGVANVLLIVSLTIMTAMGYPGITVLLSAPLILLALLGHLWLIPSMGARGAAITTVAVSCLASAVATCIIARRWDIAPPLGTVLKSALLALVMGAVSAWWPAPGLWVFAKLFGLGLISIVGYGLLREFRSAEVAVFRSWVTKANAAEMS